MILLPNLGTFLSSLYTLTHLYSEQFYEAGTIIISKSCRDKETEDQRS